MNKRRWATGLAVLALTGLLGACGDDDDDGATTAPTTNADAAQGDDETKVEALKVIATEYSFEAPSTVQAGLVKLEFENKGKLTHDSFLLDIGDKSKDEALAAFTPILESEGGVPIPDFINANGGSSEVEGGGSTETTVNLKPGNYLIVCTLDDSDSEEEEEEGGGEGAEEGGPPAEPEGPKLTKHMNLGMAVPLTVTGAAVTTLPEGDATVTAKDYTFDVSGLKAGKQTVVFNNSGPDQIHHAIVFEFEDGVTPDGAVAAFKAFGAAEQGGGPPPEGTPEPADAGGSNVFSPGRSGTFEAEFKSGRTYLFACFINDRAGGPPHAFGNDMLKAVVVE